MKIFDRGHVPEEALAELADDPAVRAGLTPSDRNHVDSCDRCQGLVEGHRRAARLLASPWQFVGSEQLAGSGTQQVHGRVTAGAAVGPFGSRRPLIVVVFVLLLLVALVWTSVFIGSDRDEQKLPLAVPAGGPSCSDMDRLADAAGAVSGGAWAETSSTAGAAADVRPGAIAGWTLSPEPRDIVLLDPSADTETRIPLQRRGRFVGSTSNLEWSPDGGALAFWWLHAESQPYCSDLFVAAGGQLIRPAPSSLAEQTSFFTWSPDSSRLAAVRSEAVAGGEHGLWLIPRDGGPILDLGGPCDNCILEYPRWSSDGSRIAIDWIEPNGAAGTQEWGLAFVDPAIGTWTRGPAADMTAVDWLDEDRLLVLGPAGLAIVSADDPALEPASDTGLAALTANLGPWALAPDRSQLGALRVRAGDGSTEVVVVDLITGEDRVVWSPAPMPTDYAEIIWSPDGSSLAISGQDAEGVESADQRGIWTVNADGSDSRRVRSEPLLTMAWQPVWP